MLGGEIDGALSLDRMHLKFIRATPAVLGPGAGPRWIW